MARSLSARRAWIEIVCASPFSIFWIVALRKESVDRNTIISQTVSEVIGSLSARRAWIEIDGVVSGSGDYVSLSARRAWIEIISFSA